MLFGPAALAGGPLPPEARDLARTTRGAWLCLSITLVCLALAVLAGWGTVTALREADRYHGSPVCEPGQSGPCRQVVAGTVAAKRVSGGKSTTRYVTVRLVDGTQRELTLNDDNGLFGTLRPGTPVTVEYWGRHIDRVTAGNLAMTVNGGVEAGPGEYIAVGLLALLFGSLTGMLAWGYVARLRFQRTAQVRGSGVMPYQLPYTARLSASAALVLVPGVLMLVAVLLNPFGHPVSTDRPAPIGLMAILGVLALLPVLILSARTLTVAEWGVEQRSLFGRIEVPFSAMTRLRVYHTKSAYLRIEHMAGSKPLDVGIGLLSRPTAAILVDAIATHAPWVELTPEARRVWGGVLP